MGHHSEPGRKRKKKISNSLSQPPGNGPDSGRAMFASPSPSQFPRGYINPHPTDVQNQFFPPPQFSYPPNQSYDGYHSSPHLHPVYGQTLQYAPRQYGLPAPQLSQHPVSQSLVHLSSPQGVLKEQWTCIDNLASKSVADLRNGATRSVNKLTSNYIDRPTQAVASISTQTLSCAATLTDAISSKFDAVLTSIDGERFSGKEQDLMIYNSQTFSPPSPTFPQNVSRKHTPHDSHHSPRSDKGSNHFFKVWLYSNSRLPPYLPPFKVYMPTYPLLCLAATYSERVYTQPERNSSETESHIPSDWRSGTKAMVLKSVPVEDLSTIVFAIRGSQTFMDWAVNYNSDPTSPVSFLDDARNLCHAGFLYVAKKMIKPVADRLRVLLQENPARSNCSLLITGHSAGGAVAALLYAHMMSTKVQSDLNYLTSFFKRVHCITFGAPPVSLYPLRKLDDKRHRKSLFYGFINEGDPVPRADKVVVRSLLKLYTSPAPNIIAASALSSAVATVSKINLALLPSGSDAPAKKSRFHFARLLGRLAKSPPAQPSHPQAPLLSSSLANTSSWPIPACSLTPAGQLVVLRQVPTSHREEDIEAVTVEADMLKGVVYGDPLKHMMTLYRTRIESVAVGAVTARGF